MKILVAPDSFKGTYSAPSRRRDSRRMTVLTDVATTFGDAASVFTPQKGATPAVVVKDLLPGQGVDSRHGNR